MISMQSIMHQDQQYSSYCAIIFVVMCDEAKESLAIVLTTSRCHSDEMLIAHRNEVLISFCQRYYFFAHFARSSCRWLFLSLEPLIQGKIISAYGYIYNCLQDLNNKFFSQLKKSALYPFSES